MLGLNGLNLGKKEIVEPRPNYLGRRAIDTRRYRPRAGSISTAMKVSVQKFIQLCFVASATELDTFAATDHCGQRKLTGGNKIATGDHGQVILVQERKTFAQEWKDGSSPSLGLGLLEGECDDCQCCKTAFCIKEGWPMIGNKWKCFKYSNGECRCGCSLGCL